MNNTVTTVLFSSIRSILNTAPLSTQALSEEELFALYTLSKKHDVAHLVGHALQAAELLPRESACFAKFEKQQMLAMLRQERLDYELAQIRSSLEEAHLPFLPLKGSVIRPLYPAPWMRTSCDIDILVKEKDLDACVEVLCERLGYKADEQKNYHDISLYAPSGVHLELHFSILENMPTLDAELSRVWEFASPIADGKSEHALTNEYLMFHSVAHAAYHFVHGGCGVRPIIDFYLMQKALPIEPTILQSHLEACSLSHFYEAVTSLSQVWLDNESPSPLTDAMQEYLLLGGVYGSMENRISLSQAQQGGSTKYLWTRIFMPYHSLCTQYPILEKHKWLTPFCQVRRWGRLLVGKTARRSIRELRASTQISEEQRDTTSELLHTLGLSNQ